MITRRTRRRQPAQDWTGVSIGIITVATIIAAATVAASVNLTQGQVSEMPSATANHDALRLTAVAGSLALFSLWAYLCVVSAGLVALFGATAREQSPIARLTVIAFYAQVFAVVIFASVIILQPLT